MPASWFQLTPLPETNPDLTLLDTLNYFRAYAAMVAGPQGQQNSERWQDDEN
jgi:hypothetical protein